MIYDANVLKIFVGMAIMLVGLLLVFFSEILKKGQK
jgi:hypothetical protein